MLPSRRQFYLQTLLQVSSPTYPLNNMSAPTGFINPTICYDLTRNSHRRISDMHHLHTLKLPPHEFKCWSNLLERVNGLYGTLHDSPPDLLNKVDSELGMMATELGELGKGVKLNHRRTRRKSPKARTEVELCEWRVECCKYTA